MLGVMTKSLQWEHTQHSLCIQFLKALVVLQKALLASFSLLAGQLYCYQVECV